MLRQILSLSPTQEGVSVSDKEDKKEIAEQDADAPEAADKSAEVAEQTADTGDTVGSKPLDEKRTQRKSIKAATSRQVSISVRTLLLALLITALVAAVGVMTWLYLRANAKLDDLARQAADNSHAERIALDYAVDAAKINAQDLGEWKKNLVKGTTPELKEKLSSAATSMEQILMPLQWNSTATPLAAKVRSNANGIYVVDTFVGVETKTIQAPDGLQSTATYSITIDSNHDWQISDVGGIGSVVGQR